jgi:uncharacterized protein YndB with AHSA1/START domain
MTENNNATAVQDKNREYVMERIFDAPRSLVFEVWSNAEHLKNWWGPKDWTLPVCELDFRPGGEWLYCMKGPAATDYMESWGKAVYHEIVEPERIVYADNFVDSEGNKIEGTPNILITLTFEETDGKTKVISRAEFDTAEDLQAVLKMGMEQGANESWDRLEDYLQTIS